MSEAERGRSAGVRSQFGQIGDQLLKLRPQFGLIREPLKDYDHNLVR